MPLTMSRMLGAPEEIQMFQNLVRLMGAKKTLDIGIKWTVAVIVSPLRAMYTLDLAVPNSDMPLLCQI